MARASPAHMFTSPVKGSTGQGAARRERSAFSRPVGGWEARPTACRFEMRVRECWPLTRHEAEAVVPIQPACDLCGPDQRAAQHATTLEPEGHVGAMLQLVRQQHRTHELRPHVRVRVAVVNERRVRRIERVGPMVTIGEARYEGESEACRCMSRELSRGERTVQAPRLYGSRGLLTRRRAHEAGASGRPCAWVVAVFWCHATRRQRVSPTFKFEE